MTTISWFSAGVSSAVAAKLHIEDMAEQGDQQMFWCNSHKREAAHVDGNGNRRCDPSLGGILLPCVVVVAQPAKPAKLEYCVVCGHYKQESEFTIWLSGAANKVYDVCISCAEHLNQTTEKK